MEPFPRPPIWLRAAVLLGLLVRPGQGQFQSQYPTPPITDVSAMCTGTGITAQVMFGGEFAGKIYSARYGTTHDCVYYNLDGMNMILFDIPNYKCGTRLSRTPDNLISRIENEIYIQFDKEAQSVADKRYLFVCDLASSSNSIDPFSPGTLNPSRTIIVQTIEPTRIVITQEGSGGFTGGRDLVSMSIRDGTGPFMPPVSRPLRLGDSITLLVASNPQPQGGSVNMFVHSCYATDGGSSRVELIDRAGCSVRERLVGPMSRQQDAGRTLYFFTISAFKFPNADDVYFSCSVDVCRDCNFAEICPGGRGKRGTEDLPAPAALVSPASAKLTEFTLHENVRFQDALEDLTRISREWTAERSGQLCLSSVASSALLSTFALTLVSLAVMTIYVLVFLCRRGPRKGFETPDSAPSLAEDPNQPRTWSSRYGDWSPYKASSSRGTDSSAVSSIS